MLFPPQFANCYVFVFSVGIRGSFMNRDSHTIAYSISEDKNAFSASGRGGVDLQLLLNFSSILLANFKQPTSLQC